MKHYKIFVYSAVLLLTACTLSLHGQQKKIYDKCGTDAFLQTTLKKFPGYKNTLQRANQLLDAETQKRLARMRSAVNRRERVMEEIVTIPVVVHIVLPDPGSVSDAEVQLQLDVLNRDFSGLNADSSNLAPMYPYSLRGHSGLRFCLAQQDGQGNHSNGIERRCSGTMADMEPEDVIKQTSKGGLDAWDPSRYFNIWVGNSSLAGLLGYATYPFSFEGYTSPAPRFQGVVISRVAFGDIRTAYAFNRGRTLVHETGHFFGLFHPFEGGCEDRDFSLYSVGSSISDDTPPQLNSTSSGNTSTTSCPSGNRSSGCPLSNDSGRLYQNFMDYTDDPCLTMFTVNQVARMETAISLFQPSLKNSSACAAPPTLTNDLSVIEMLDPFGGREGLYAGCTGAGSSNIYCTGNLPYELRPRIRIRNTGSAPVTQLQIGFKKDDSPDAFNTTISFTPGLTYLSDTIVTLNPVFFDAGAHQLRIFTTNPNGQADGKPDNDTVLANLFIDLPSAGPIVEGFETGTFPPAGWKVINADADAITWQRTLLAQQSGNASAFISLYNDDTPDHIDYLVSPAINTRRADSILVSFDRAYRQYSLGSVDHADTLELVISEDCGNSFKSVWKKSGAALATNPGPTGFIEWYPAKADWLRVAINVKPFMTAGAGSLHVGFRATNGYGQNVFLDNISVSAHIPTRTDAAVVRITEPGAGVCPGGFTPAIEISNSGIDTLQSAEVGYSIDGSAPVLQTWTGSLVQGGTATISFPSLTVAAAGQHVISAFVSKPNEQPDQNRSNDSMQRRFDIFSAVAAPVEEGFEGTSFPPVNWAVHPSSELTHSWQRNTRASSLGIASTVQRNRVYNGNGAFDDLYSPLVQHSGSDSVFARFDLAYVPVKYPSNNGTVTDTLEVFFTADCGKTLQSVYKKWGRTLQTVPETYVYAYDANDTVGFVPASTQLWRTDSIDLTTLAGSSGTFQLIFRNINNYGNNLYLDNIRITPLVLPARLKNRGYMVMPNPSAGLFYIRHYLRPVNLKAMQVVNANGQTILTRQYNGDGLSNIPVDLSAYASGVYIVRLVYTDKVVSERIIKMSK